MKHVVKILLLLCTLVHTSICFAEKPVLRVVAEEWQGSTNADLTGKYWDIVRAVYAEQYDLEFEVVSRDRALNLVSKNQADIVIGVYKGQFPNVLTPALHLDMDSSFYLLFDSNKHKIKSISDIDNLNIAGISNYVLKSRLPPNVKLYPMDNLANVARLIEKGRLDGALLYASDLNSADPKKQLEHVEILPKQKMYLGFPNTKQGKQLASIYDEKMPILLAQGKVKEFFDNDLSFQFAEYFSKDHSNPINWYLIAKLYQGDSSLKTLRLDHLYGDYVANHFKNYQFNLKLGSVSVVDSVINAEDKSQNNCVINVFKNPKRSQYALFSKPINTYIRPRLITKENSKSTVIKEASNQGVLNLDSLLTDNPQFRLGIVNKGFAYRTLSNKLPKALFEKIMVFEDAAYGKVIKMLNADRLDAIILWPTVLPEIIPEGVNVQSLTSYTLEEGLGKDISTYLMCNDTPLNQKFIRDINSALDKPDEQRKLYQGLVNSFDEETGKLFKKSLALDFE
ncbi:hypothetical protein theurythT_24930 [Thalassotalea eurytherma]|uniref:Solute-binding protein family 3/N-terminal domain-containing protein n=2 Tax=Thalassotalea eurytherma TaxID=1144278 RepID=A0ABQ6H860_9GAMM|nr:hypothetical protein theurythT_24930 [Thalassotalea eurytherma]